tara:strand:+ start:1517 stop:3490 length:1974 start_codon:yes stop_codon:yes gene_type:complete
MVNSIVTNDNYSLTSTNNKTKDPLVGWIVDKVRDWEDYRNTNFREKWNEYYRLWRGLWKSEDKTRESERSRLIAPALQQAIEVTVAELEEAVFSSKRWVDIDKTSIDNPEEQQIMGVFIDELLKQYELAKVPDALSEIFLNGAIYGTGIGKVVVKPRITRTPMMDELGNLTSQKVVVPEVSLIAIDPMEFAIDPLAKSINDAEGCAHILYSHKDAVKRKQDDGVYANVDIGSGKDDSDYWARGEASPLKKQDWVKITEYHGRVPSELLEPIGAAVEEELNILSEELTKQSDTVEAIVTIANDGVLLRAVENPFFMQDRSIIAYQHDRVPNRFWGRGIAEKGYSPQKALDTELRGRIDAMSYAIHPMVAINAALVPRDLNTTFKVYPGRSIFTNGPAAEAIQPINFQPPTSLSFNQSGDLERMVEMGTGAFQAAASINSQPQNQTASGMSMVTSASIKRNKRTLQNIEVNLLDEWVKKSAYRYMQLDSEKYPLVNLRFVINSTLGIMARELEVQQLVQLLNTSPPNSPSYWMLIKSLYQLSNISNREEMMPIIDQQLQQSLQPQEPETDPVAMELVKIEADKAQTDAFKAGSDAVYKKTAGILNLAKAEQIEDDNIIQGFQGIKQLEIDTEKLEKERQEAQIKQQEQLAAQAGQLPIT